MIDLSRYRGQTVAVMGLGKSGLATARALHAAGAQVIAWDDETARREAARRQDIPVGDLTQAPWQDIDLLVLSPGIPHSHPAPHPIAVQARKAGRPIVGDIELLARASTEACYIGITGTNGKSTTTSLIGHLLRESGRPAAVGGNLGLPALEFEPMGDDGFYVIEMSSYQLELTAPIPFDVAILTNITPDHLDRHGGMPGYIAAKERIFDGQDTSHAAVIGVDDDICRSIFNAPFSQTCSGSGSAPASPSAPRVKRSRAVKRPFAESVSARCAIQSCSLRQLDTPAGRAAGGASA
jgi:UDP-N-acetylmuramoylalanine--D-glutamate ligase